MFNDNPGSYESKEIDTSPSNLSAHEILAQVDITTNNPPSPEYVKRMNKMIELQKMAQPKGPEGKEGRVSFGHGYEPLTSMDLPGWVHQPSPALSLLVSEENYTPSPDDTKPIVIQVKSAMPSGADPKIAAPLQQLLASRCHDDSASPRSVTNVNGIQPALVSWMNQDQPNMFKPDPKNPMWTEKIDGKCVLFFKGQYTSDHNKALTAYIDADPKYSGQQLLTVSYIASPELFDKYLPYFEKQIKTAKFNPQSPEQAGSSSQ